MNSESRRTDGDQLDERSWFQSQALLPSNSRCVIGALEQGTGPQDQQRQRIFVLRAWQSDVCFCGPPSSLYHFTLCAKLVKTLAQHREAPVSRQGSAAAMASGGRKMLSAEERRRQRELEEARKAGLAPAEVSPLSGRRSRARLAAMHPATICLRTGEATASCRSGRRLSEGHNPWRQRWRRQQWRRRQSSARRPNSLTYCYVTWHACSYKPCSSMRRARRLTRISRR